MFVDASESLKDKRRTNVRCDWAFYSLYNVYLPIKFSGSKLILPQTILLCFLFDKYTTRLTTYDMNVTWMWHEMLQVTTSNQVRMTCQSHCRGYRNQWRKQHKSIEWKNLWWTNCFEWYWICLAWSTELGDIWKGPY